MTQGFLRELIITQKNQIAFGVIAIVGVGALAACATVAVLVCV